MFLSVTVPMEVAGQTPVAPGHLDDINLGTVSSFVADTVHSIRHQPEGGPVAFLTGQANAGGIIAKGVLELARGVDGATGVARSIFARAQE